VTQYKIHKASQPTM